MNLSKQLLRLSFVVAIVASLISRRWRAFNTPCQEDPPVEIPGFSGKIDTCSVFSENYHQARSRFREAVAEIETAQQYAIEINDGLTIDVAVLPGTLKGLVVHTSGVHGVEGYAGSAIQIALVKLLKSMEYPTIVLIHAFNPVGMANYRRANEHNVDLNRNAIRDWDALDRDSNREKYDQFDSLFNHATLPTPFEERIGFWIKGISAIVVHGAYKIKNAMVQAQYHKPEGVFYGGSTKEPSIVKVEEWMKEFLQLKNQPDAFPAVTWIDVHTGLGELGQDTLMIPPISRIGYKRDVVEEMERWFPQSHSPFYGTFVDPDSVHRGYEKVKGFTTDYFEDLFSASQRPLLMAQEIGTVHMVLVGHALILENAAHNHLPADEALEWAQRLTRRAFYPQNSAWRKAVIERGLSLLMQAMERSSSLSNEQ